MRIAVIGQGYVGLPLALAAGKIEGHQVTGIDSNSELVDKINNGKSPILDINSSEIEFAIKNESYKASTDFKLIFDCEVVIICVPTPLNTEGDPDISMLENASEQVSKHLKNGTLVIIESTVSPGTVRNQIHEILQKSNKEFELAYSPERIDPSNKKWNIVNTPKLVSGLTDLALQRALDFYKTFVTTVIPGSSLEVVETAKLLENTFRLINISFINEFADFCSKMGIDVREVIAAANTKPYGFMPFYPSAGVGGHCIPVDPSYLLSKAKELGASTKFIDLANEINNAMPTYFKNICKEMIGNLSGKQILIIGIAYKPNVADLRESPALELINLLRAEGAKVEWCDNLVQNWNDEKTSDLQTEFDLAILVNPHSDFEFSSVKAKKVLDTHGGY